MNKTAIINWMAKRITAIFLQLTNVVHRTRTRSSRTRKREPKLCALLLLIYEKLDGWFRGIFYCSLSQEEQYKTNELIIPFCCIYTSIFICPVPPVLFLRKTEKIQKIIDKERFKHLVWGCFEDAIWGKNILTSSQW